MKALLEIADTLGVARAADAANYLLITNERTHLCVTAVEGDKLTTLLEYPQREPSELDKLVKEFTFDTPAREPLTAMQRGRLMAQGPDYKAIARQLHDQLGAMIDEVAALSRVAKLTHSLRLCTDGAHAVYDETRNAVKGE